MQKNNYSALFGVVMILLLIPFVPAFIEGQFDNDNNLSDFAKIPTTYASSHPKQASVYITTGYIGQYGPSAISSAEDEPLVLGITATRNQNSPPPYQAQETDRSNSVVNLNPGQSVTVWVDFLNTGSATWYNTGDHFVALNLAEPAGRHSQFQHEFWKEDFYRPARLLQNQVRPGATGRFRFALQAPMDSGIYTEEFHLVAENLTWIEGGYFSFKIGVDQTVTGFSDYQTQEISRTKAGEVDVEPGQAFTFEVNLKNTGLKNWYNSGNHFIALNVTGPVARVSSFKHDYWNEYYYRPARLLQSRIYPGETGTFRFALRAPNVEGYYTEKFALVAENLLWLPGGEITLNLKVGNPTPQALPLNYSVENEPNLRVGLFQSEEAVTITANGSYSVIDMNTDISIKKISGEPTTINYSDTTYFRLIADDSGTIFEIINFDNSPLWDSTLNDNTYRGVIEIRYSDETGEMWVINEIPLESYLKGLAEVSNEQPTEYLKSLITGARSYALWHKVHGGKHADNFYDINATTDQVYRGYGFEQRSVDPLLAVQATAGQVITHPDAVANINPQGIAIAAYSSGTDGRTRTWSEVWAGSGFPWLVSVDDPHGILPNWDTLEGNHMVGLSAKGARGYALEDNKTFDWILQHYYTGTTVKKIY